MLTAEANWSKDDYRRALELTEQTSERRREAIQRGYALADDYDRRHLPELATAIREALNNEILISNLRAGLQRILKPAEGAE